MRRLLKALLTTGASTIATQMLGLVIAKILAVNLGASGIGFYSLLRQTHDTATGVGALCASGMVQGLAARQDSARTRLWWAAIALMLFGALVTAGVLLLASRPLAGLLFDRDDAVAATAVALCAGTAVLGILFTTVSAGVHAARAIGAMATISVGAALVAALIAWPVARLGQDYEPYLALLIGVPLVAQTLAALIVLRRIGWLPGSPAAAEARPGKPEFVYFAGFIGSNIVMTVVGGLSLLFIRSSVVHADGLAAAGLFAAAWGLGMQSISVLLGAFGAYVLPSLAAGDAAARRQLMQDAATLMLALSLPLLAGLIAWKPLALRALYSAEFLPAATLLQWLLLGNWLKLLSWVCVIPFPATADLRRYVLMELAWYAVLVGGCALAVAVHAPLAGIGIAFFASYAFYLALVAWMSHRRFGFALSRRNQGSFAAGLLLLAGVAALTWNGQAMDWPVAVLAPIAAAVVSFLTLTPHHRARGWQLVRGMRRS